MTKYKIALAAGVLGVTVAAGFAAAEGWRHHHRGMGGGIAVLLERYDADKDGKISQDEINQNRQSWHGEFDGDKDGALTIAEFERLWLKARREQMVREYQDFDRDGDGKVTLEEYQGPLANLVAERDRNGDGVLSREDRRRGKHHRRPMQDDDQSGDAAPPADTQQ
jgi:hypothetical protein